MDAGGSLRVIYRPRLCPDPFLSAQTCQNTFCLAWASRVRDCAEQYGPSICIGSRQAGRSAQRCRVSAENARADRVNYRREFSSTPRIFVHTVNFAPATPDVSHRASPSLGRTDVRTCGDRPSRRAWSPPASCERAPAMAHGALAHRRPFPRVSPAFPKISHKFPQILVSNCGFPSFSDSTAKTRESMCATPSDCFAVTFRQDPLCPWDHEAAAVRLLAAPCGCRTRRPTTASAYSALHPPARQPIARSQEPGAPCRGSDTPPRTCWSWRRRPRVRRRASGRIPLRLLLLGD